MLQLLEAGQPLPPDPRQMGRPKESAQSFLRRMDKLQARYDAQFFKRKDWQVCTCTHMVQPSWSQTLQNSHTTGAQPVCD